ncbi:pilus assembly protein [Burkholderia sp. WAC0059]|uniref:type 4 pilus major pilin n=1 Tax=Burkholderia sp. WAC0059 TaxID=2066022 RepID=UPI000C7E96E7|nr:type 4 pilus major pilin [Burkholderia sp. WAC0059]PLY99997.1 pilus assembly protein [Burkholderia sp. WAC0059]
MSERHFMPDAMPGRRPPRRRERGLTLLEAVAFLGVAAIVLAGALALFTESSTNASANRLVSEVNAIVANVNSLYLASGDGGYGGLGAANTGGTVPATLANANVFPTTLRVSVSGNNATVYNQWGGYVTVGAVGNFLEVIYTNVPQNVCIRALTSSQNGAVIAVNSTSYGNTLTIDQVETACSQSYDTIQWSFQ